MGGGGGAGEGNNGATGAGGKGAGLVFVLAGTVQGSGKILADGAAGGAAASANGASGDAPGGGGGGGSVVVHATALSGISVEANGGVGGKQTVNNGNEAEGPGGGGGGGYVALSGGTPAAVSAGGGLGGTTNSGAMVKFPSNGATAGHDGVANGDATTIVYCTANGTLDTTIASAPANPTSVAAGAFTFTSNQTGVTFECSLDGGAYATCPASYTTPALGSGSHTLDVRAKDAGGNVDATPAHYDWVVNLTLDTVIAGAPAALTNVAAAVFGFTSPQSPVTFECSLDGAAYVACPATYTVPTTPALADGPHTLDVRAKDAGGNVDTTPAHYDWTLDRVAPNARIVTGPALSTTSTTADFTISSDSLGEEAITFECQLDAGTFVSCLTGFTIDGLTDGTHTLSVRARDVAGNATDPPAAYTWVVHIVSADAGVDASPPDAATPDVQVILKDAAVPDTKPDSAVVLLDARADVTTAVDVALDSSPDSNQDLLPASTPDARPDAGDAAGVDAMVVVGPDARDAQLVIADARPSDVFVPPPTPDAPIVPPTPDAAVPVVPPVGNEPKVMGSGFCAVSPMRDSTPGLCTFFLVGAFGLLIRRRRR
jgi:hypothetical protein